MLIFARISRNHYQSIICTIMYKNLKSIALVALAVGVREKTKENREAAPVMIIDVESKEVCSAQKENAYRTLEKFYRSK